MSVADLLKPQLEEVRKKAFLALPESAQKVLRESAQKLAFSDLVNGAKNEGDKAPDFTLTNAWGKNVKLGDLLAKGPVALNFYRGLWCPFCRLQLKAFEKVWPQIELIGASLVAVSPQTIERTLETVQKQGLTYSVLSDQGASVARDYGIVYTLDASLKPLYKESGKDLPEFNGDDSYALPIPATYIIDTDKTINFAHLDTDYTRRIEPGDMVNRLKKLTTRRPHKDLSI